MDSFEMLARTLDSHADPYAGSDLRHQGHVDDALTTSSARNCNARTGILRLKSCCEAIWPKTNTIWKRMTAN